jgi:hypothetical protein
VEIIFSLSLTYTLTFCPSLCYHKFISRKLTLPLYGIEIKCREFHVFLAIIYNPPYSLSMAFLMFPYSNVKFLQKENVKIYDLKKRKFSHKIHMHELSHTYTLLQDYISIVAVFLFLTYYLCKCILMQHRVNTLKGTCFTSHKKNLFWVTLPLILYFVQINPLIDCTYIRPKFGK